MSGQYVHYRCKRCGHKWEGIRHHGGTVPPCPECGSSDVTRKKRSLGARFVFFIFIIGIIYGLLLMLGGR